MGARKKIIKVIKALKKAGITPDEARYIIFADMHEMLYSSAQRDNSFDTLLLALSRAEFDTDLIVEKFEVLTNIKK